MNKVIILVFCSLLIFCNISLSYAIDDSYYEDLYNKTEEAIKQGNEQESDFYLARYMGLSFLDQDSEKNFTDVYPLLKEHKVSKPTSFISGKYSKDFLEWFMFSSYVQWGRDDDEDIDPETHSMGLRSGGNEEYIVTIIAKPFLEGWSVIKSKDIRTAILALAGDARITLMKHNSGVPEKLYDEIILGGSDNLIQTIWSIDFYDLDGDDVDEVWVRYNAAMASGFMQVLAIYKIEDKGLVLFKEFKGEAEGIARRLEDGKIEVGYSYSNESQGHLGYEKHHLEVWEYKDKGFMKISEKEVDHILWTDEWQRYYFSGK